MQRNQDECAPVHLRMGNLQARTVDQLVAVQKEIEVQGSRLPSDRPARARVSVRQPAAASSSECASSVV